MMKRKRCKSYLILFAGMFMLLPFCMAQWAIGSLTPTLHWSDPTDGDPVDGYILKYDFDSGEPYGIEVDVGYTNEYTLPLALIPSSDYYFIVLGYNVDGNGPSTLEKHYSTFDSDGDGLLDGDEVNYYGTSIDNVDSDGDGITDYDEVTMWGDDWDTDADNDGTINLLDYDADDDGLSDGQEFYIYGTDPTLYDSDNDGLADNDEVTMWGDDWNTDADNDGTINLLDYDADGDGLSDGQEYSIYGTNPAIADSDSDGLTDQEEVTLWATNWGADLDGDGIINILDPDSDGDGILDGSDASPGTATLAIVSPTVILSSELIISIIL